MQVTVNGQAVDRLAPELERDLVSGRPQDRVEGVVMTADQAVDAAAENRRVLYAVTSGFAALVVVLALIAAASYEPRDLVFLVPLVLLLAGGLAMLMSFTFRRRTAKVRQRALLQLPRMPPAGAPVIVEAAALGIGEDRYPWSALDVEALDVTATTFNDAPLTLIERLELGGGAALPVVLDAQLLRNGRAVVDETWRRLREAGG